MSSGNHRKAFLVSAALLGGALVLTGCQDSGAATDTGAAPAPSAAAPSGKASAPSGASTAGAKQGGKGTADGSGADTGNGVRKPVGQTCGANDIAWSATSETQAGGYVLITAKAKPGITCYLPAALPTVAFGSDGTQAGPAEHAAARQIQLSGSTAAYAGVSPKTTKENGGKELNSIIVAVGDSDPNPVSLPVGTITVDHP
ncbi:hypothetical protein PL81_25285, partial [Streptomyces sp. RSD-27]